jgi:hypothetical protein
MRRIAEAVRLAFAWLAALGWAALFGWLIIAVLIPSGAKDAGFTGRLGVMTIGRCYTPNPLFEPDSTSVTCKGAFVADDDSDHRSIEVTLAGSGKGHRSGDEIVVRVTGDTARPPSAFEMTAVVWGVVTVGVVGVFPLGWLARRARDRDLSVEDGLASIVGIVFGFGMLCLPVSLVVTVISALLD